MASMNDMIVEVNLVDLTTLVMMIHAKDESINDMIEDNGKLREQIRLMDSNHKDTLKKKDDERKRYKEFFDKAKGIWSHGRAFDISDLGVMVQQFEENKEEEKPPRYTTY